MKKSEVKIGKTYWANVSDERVPVRIESENPSGGWIGRSIKTGREVKIKTAGRLHGECEAEEQAEVSREAKPNRRSRKKAPAKTTAKAKPKAGTKQTRKVAKDKRREAIIDAIVAVLPTDPKKAMAVGEIHAALVEAETHAACGEPSHGALFYALKIEIERNLKTRIMRNDADLAAAYHLRKKK